MRLVFRLGLVLALVILVGAASASTEVVLLKSPGCTKCAAAEKVLSSMAGKEDLNITGYYYYSDEGHRIIKEKKVKGDIPAIVIGNRVINYKQYNGSDEKLEQLISDALHNQSSTGSTLGAADNLTQSSTNKSSNQSSLDNGNGPEINLQSLSLSTLYFVLAAGVVAGFNPCLLGVLVFLAASVLSSNGRKRELLMMIVFFSLGIFTMYFLFGLGMQRLLQTDAIFATFRYAVTLFLVVIGLAHIVDAVKLRRGGESLFRTDWALKYFRSGVDRGRLSSYFLVGALFSLVKAPCVGAVYLAILDMISSQSYYEGVVCLLFYNIGIILPILILGGFMAMGLSPTQVDAWRKNYRSGIRLFTGIMLLMLAPLIYFQVI